MSSIAPITLDPTKLTPAQLESIARLGFANNKVPGFLPCLLSPCIDAFCLGIVAVLVGLWAKHAKPTERPAHRAMVYYLCFAALLNSAVIQGQTLHMFAYRFGEYRAFFDAQWSRWTPLLGGLIRVPVSFFFLHRAWLLVGRKPWILIVVVPQLLFILFGLVALNVVFTIPYKNNVRILIACISGVEVLSDLIITISIAVQLWKSRTGFAKTDRLIQKLLFQLAETSAPPTILAFAILLIFALMPNSTIQIVMLFHYKIQIACVLISLLGRVYLAEEQRNESSAMLSDKISSGRFGSRLTGVRDFAASDSGLPLARAQV